MSNQGLIFLQTVQTASPWRPQLPLPKDITAHVQQQQQQQQRQKQQDMDRAVATKSKDKKWSLGSLFRKKKKELDTDSSSEEDRKAGFVPVKAGSTLNGKRKKRSSRIVGAGFDHIVVSPHQHQQHPLQQQVLLQTSHNQYGFRESESINAIDPYPANGSLDRHTATKKDRGGGVRSKERQSSSDEESHRSSSMSRFRSDDSLGNHSAGSHRKSRTARTERYLKRMSGRDDGHSPQGAPNRWHTQPISPSMLPQHAGGGSIRSVDVAYRRPGTFEYHASGGSHPNLRNSASLTNVGPHAYRCPSNSSPGYGHQVPQAYPPQSPPTATNPHTVTYENSFYIQSKVSSMRDAIRSPPPIPPRDPQRRLTIGHTNEARPVSYAFDRYHQLHGPTGSIWQSNGKCTSEDRLWGGSGPTVVHRTPPPPAMQGAFTVTPPRASSVQPAELQQQQQQPPKQRYISRQQQTPVVVHPPPSTPPSNVVYHHHQHHQQHQQQQQQPHHHHHHHHHQHYRHATLPVSSPHQQQLRSAEYRYVTDVSPRSRKPIQIQDRTFEPYDPKVSPQPPATGSESSLVYSGTTTPSGGVGGRSTSRSFRADSSESVNDSSTTGGGARTPQQSASAFWRRIEEEQSNASATTATGGGRRGRATERRPGVAGMAATSRSVSTSRALEIMNRRNQELTRELDSLLDDKQQHQKQDVVSGRLYLRQSDGASGAPIRSPNQKVYEVKPKGSSHPANSDSFAQGGNKYEEHVAKTVAGSQTVYRRYGGEEPESSKSNGHQTAAPPAPPMRTISKRNSCSEEELARKRKSANLEEAISELEAIYKSLKLSDEDLLERAEQRDVPTPTGFSSRARTYRYEPDPEEDRAKPEPDLQLDDLSYRSIKRANSKLRTANTQPPFGIPVGPIPPPPNTDYLTVQTPARQQTPRYMPRQSPDLVTDDLAFRQLRKDKDLQASLDRKPGPATMPVSGNTSSESEDSRTKRNSGSLSSSIYNQIQRDAAKPSGGNLEDYYKLELYAKSLRESTAKPKAAEQRPKDPSPPEEARGQVRAKNTGTPPTDRNRGAVFNLPSTLKSSSSGSPPKSPRSTDGASDTKSTTPTPRPRSGTEPIIVGAKHKAEFEEILNAIALEAQTTSEKLGADLAELRKETQSVSSGTSPEAKPNRRTAVSKTIAPVATAPSKVFQKTSDATNEVTAKYCEEMLRDVIEEDTKPVEPAKRPGKDIVPMSSPAVNVSQATVAPNANPTIVLVESNDGTKPSVADTEVLEPPVTQLTPAGSFEALSKHCQEQFSELEDSVAASADDERVKSSIERDYDNLVESIKPFESDSDKKSTEEEIDLIMKECGIELEMGSSAPSSKAVPQKFPASGQPDLSDILSLERDRVLSGECLKPSVIAAEQRKRSGSSKSPPGSSVRLTPSDTESQYNSSEELAMIFGIKSPSPSENKPFANSAIFELEKKLSSVTAKLSCQPQPETSYQHSPSLHPSHSNRHKLPLPPASHHTPPLVKLQPTLTPPQRPREEPLPLPPVAPPSESSSLQAILQVIRAEKQHEQQRHQQRKGQHREQRSTSTKHCAPQTLPPPKFSAVNFRRIQRHPPVSYPKRPLVTQRSLGSPPSVNLGSSYSPSGTAGNSNSGVLSGAPAISGVYERRRAPHRRHESTFLKTRSKTISDFFGPESTPVSRLLNIICQEKEAERVAHIMNQQQQSSRPNVASGASSHVVTRGSRTVKPAKTGARSAVNNSGSDSGSGSASCAPVLVDPAYAAKDIDRIAKYRADRRKPIYLRNIVHENENERLEPSKRSSSRTPNSLPSSAISSKTQPSTLPLPSKPTTSNSSIVKRPHTTGTATTASKVPSGSSGQANPPTNGHRDPAAGGSNPQSPVHGQNVATVSTAQPRTIRTTRSSRLRAAATHAPDKPTASSGSAAAVLSATVATGGSDEHQRKTQRTLLTRTSPNGTLGKHSTDSPGRKAPIPTNTGMRANKLLPLASKREPQETSRLRKTPTAAGVVSTGNASSSGDNEVKRLVPSIAVNMKQRLKTTSETIKGVERSIVKPVAGPASVAKPKSQKGAAVTATLEITSKQVGDLAPVQDRKHAKDSKYRRLTFLEQPTAALASRPDNPTTEPSTNEAIDCNDSSFAGGTPRMRTSTLKRSHAVRPEVIALPRDVNGLSPVKSIAYRKGVSPEKDKSSKRKSFLNRSQTEESANAAAISPKLSPPEAPSKQHYGSSSAGSSPVRICSRLSTCGGLSNNPHAVSKSRSPPLAYHMEQARRQLITSPPRLKRPAARIDSELLAAAVDDPMPLLNDSLDSEQSIASSCCGQPTEKAPVAAEGRKEDVEKTSDGLELPASGAAQSVLAFDEPDEISEEQSSSIGQYSKFSQILKSPTLEVAAVTLQSESIVIVGVHRSVEDLQAVEEEEQMIATFEVPPVVGKESVQSRITLAEEMEAGPSGLCSARSNTCERIDDNDDDEDDDDETDVIKAEKDIGPTRGYIAVVDASLRPANRILFDDQFNDEFVVIENNPKSQLIHSLDEEDIIVLRDHDEDYTSAPPSRPSSGEYLEGEKKLLKMSSVEHFERKSLSPQRSKQSTSPIFRAKSMDEGSSGNLGIGNGQTSAVTVSGTTSNHIVSILKRKTVESTVSSTSSNASPVTFSPSVVDTPIRSNRKQGILKKRCSLDESRYSRSHSPDDRSILVRHTRRNSFEDGAASGSSTAGHHQQQHGILKQKSYESREDVSGSGSGGTASRNSTINGVASNGSGTGCGSSVSHGILKKKNDSSSTSTPSEHPKHVSISQAVILAAAEICQDMLLVDDDADLGGSGGYDIKPILKSDHQAPMAPKPILKKKYSSESEEIRPILKSSRKSSREENSDSEEIKRSILKTDSPAKRRSCYVEQSAAADLMVSSMGSSISSDSAPSAGSLSHTRSLELPDAVSSTAVVPQVTNIEKPIISVAERIMNMEKFLSGASSSSHSSHLSSRQQIPSALTRRESFRYKTQPVTSIEINRNSTSSVSISVPANGIAVFCDARSAPRNIDDLFCRVQQQQQQQTHLAEVTCQSDRGEPAESSSGGLVDGGDSNAEHAVENSDPKEANERCAAFAAGGSSVVKFSDDNDDEKVHEIAAIAKDFSSTTTNNGGDAGRGLLQEVTEKPELPIQSDRSLAPEHSCLRSSLELLIQRANSVDRGTGNTGAKSAADGPSAPFGDPKPSSSFELHSPTLVTTESNSHSIISGEFNLASLSSDSGVQLGGIRGATEELSGTTDYVSSVKTSDSEKSPSKKTIDEDLNDVLGNDDPDDDQLLMVQVAQQNPPDSDDDLRPVRASGRSVRRQSAGGAVLLSPTSSCSSHNHFQRRPSSSSSSSSSSEGGTGTGGVGDIAGPASGCLRAHRGSPRGSTSSASNSDSSSDLSDRESAAVSRTREGESAMFGGCVGFGRSGGSCGGGGGGSGDDSTDKGFLRRSNSVRAKASMFAQLESKLKENENPLGRPNVLRPRRAPQFTTQTISPTDVERSNNAINSGLSFAQRPSTTAPPSITNTIMHTNVLSNNNIVSDDSGTEFDPSTLKVSKKVKLFSGGCLAVRSEEHSEAMHRLTVIQNGQNDSNCSPVTSLRRKKIWSKVRNIGRVVTPKFLNDNNNNISVQQQQELQQQANKNGEVVTDSDGDTELAHIILPKVDSIRRKFMCAQSTPKFLNSTTVDSCCPKEQSLVVGPHQQLNNGDGSSSESNVDSGKENNYDCGMENTNGFSNRSTHQQQQQQQGAVLAMKRNFLNASNRAKSLYQKDVSAELDGVVVKGKVSQMANQWNQVRSISLDVSSITKLPGANFDTPSSPLPNDSVGKRQRASMHDEHQSFHDSSLDRSVSHSNHSATLFTRSFSRSNGASKFALIEDRFAKYFGMENNGQNGTSHNAGYASSKLRRNGSVREKSAVDGGFNAPRHRSLSMPKESLMLQQKLDPIITAIASNDEPIGDGNRGSVHFVNNFDELNITAEKLSTADVEFDKLFKGV
ncbi:uncharacterized protein LOC131215292 [Anopheles bellator]|uniref:uncharacterized protein LOC131215292 n=1 Tax=Anopheles bellator TaxID=139047 RepID=UPI0026494C6B|nr:uncharacterized protein LOC131215292 [Anopheles bellator]